LTPTAQLSCPARVCFDVSPRDVQNLMRGLVGVVAAGLAT
jgi:hypothetical protein